MSTKSIKRLAVRAKRSISGLNPFGEGSETSYVTRRTIWLKHADTNAYIKKEGE
jgi:hypothetical protein